MTDLGGVPTRKTPEPFAFRPRADGTVKCRECGDSKFVEVENAALGSVPTVRPCSKCRPEAYKRWVEGFPQKGGGRHGYDDLTKTNPQPAKPAPPVPEQGTAF